MANNSYSSDEKTCVISPYGEKRYNEKGEEKTHQGIDYGCINPKGCLPPSPIKNRAAADGTVIFSGYHKNKDGTPGYGNLVIVEHTGNDGKPFATLYGHNLIDTDAMPGVGTKVKAGDVIGEIGNTGHSKGEHLHYGIITN